MSRPTHVITVSLVAFCLLAVASYGAHAEFSKKRQSGLWEVAIQRGNPAQPRPVTVKECVDSSSDDQILKIGNRLEDIYGCSRKDHKETLDGYRAYAECPQGLLTMITQVRFSGDFRSSYKAEASTTFQPPHPFYTDSKITITGTYKGACPEGMKPWDVEIGLVRLDSKELAERCRQLSLELSSHAGAEFVGGRRMKYSSSALSVDHFIEFEGALEVIGRGCSELSLPQKLSTD